MRAKGDKVEKHWICVIKLAIFLELFIPLGLFSKELLLFKGISVHKIVMSCYFRIHCNLSLSMIVFAVADPGLPVGGADLVWGHQVPRQLRFENFVCRSKRIWTLRGHALAVPPGSANALILSLQTLQNFLSLLIFLFGILENADHMTALSVSM